jgi:multimeric flavodoxin WrbA
MKFVGILGSARKGGNTDVLLNVALEEAKESAVFVDKIFLKDKSIAPCDGCMGCTKTGRCVIDDDAQDIYYVFNTPSACGGVSASSLSLGRGVG